MKKIFLILLVALTGCAGLNFPPLENDIAPLPHQCLGDLNSDGQVTAEESAVVLMVEEGKTGIITVGNNNYDTSRVLEVSDENQDGKITTDEFYSVLENQISGSCQTYAGEENEI